MNLAQKIGRDRLSVSLQVIFLIGLFWMARYFHSSDFGLYEDDFTFVPQAIEMNLGELGEFIATYIVNLYGHGRPLSDSSISLASHVGWNIGGLQAIYIIGFVIEAMNIALFFLLLRRVASPGIALLGGIAYALFSGDTTQAFLIHSLGLQPAMTLLLLGFHAFLSHRHLATYLLAIGILFTYEVPYTVFFAAPLLHRPWDIEWRRRSIRHLIVLGLILLGGVLVRIAIDDDRVLGLSLTEAVAQPILRMAQGPIVALGSYFYRPIELLLSQIGEAWIATVLAAFTLATVIGLGFRFRERQLSNRDFLMLVAAGIALLALAYPLAFTTRVTAISGRETRSHLAAAPGAALLIGVGGSYLISQFERRKLRGLAVGIVGSFFALLVGFGFVVQRDYQRAWELQQEFWREIIPEIRDAVGGTTVLVEPSGLGDTLHIGANTWNLPRILEQVYEFPQDWDAPPRVIRLQREWSDHLIANNGLFRLNPVTAMMPESLSNNIPSSTVLWIETESGSPIRRTTPLEMEQRSYSLKPIANRDFRQYQRGILYEILIEDSGS
ncbi:MAG: hypothetical protein ACE5JF_12365 [Anaerolineales bacterium]